MVTPRIFLGCRLISLSIKKLIFIFDVDCLKQPTLKIDIFKPVAYDDRHKK
jgi:hypothetical protein